jgi:hypothetical protein
MHLHTVHTEYSECLPTLLNPLAERSCFSQVSIHEMKDSEECPSSCTERTNVNGVCECAGCAANHPDEYPTVDAETLSVPLAFCGTRFTGFMCAECVGGHIKVGGECQPGSNR